MKKLLFLSGALVLLAAACNSQSNPPQNNQTQNPPVTTTPQAQVYENQYMKLTVSDGWVAKQAGANQGAVNVTKGKYILYINTQAQQASGVEGGRFAEIAMGAPSADAVVTEQPSPPCGTSVSQAAMLDHPRVDLYVNQKDKLDYCNVPSGSQTVWYFSYITNANGGYFNYYKNDQPPGFVITMAYDSKDVNQLPIKGSEELQKALDDMSGIAQSLQIKKW